MESHNPNHTFLCYILGSATHIKSQKNYLLNIKLTFILSLVSAVLGFFGLTSSNFAFTSAALIFFSILATIYLVLSKKDQTWYRSRALAESVKSISFKYATGAEPFSLQLEAKLWMTIL